MAQDPSELLVRGLSPDGFISFITRMMIASQLHEDTCEEAIASAALNSDGRGGSGLVG